MNIDDFTLLGASVLWVALFGAAVWVGVPTGDE